MHPDALHPLPPDVVDEPDKVTLDQVAVGFGRYAMTTPPPTTVPPTRPPG